VSAARAGGPSRVGVFTVGYLALFAAWGLVRAERRVVAYLVVAGLVALVARRAHRAVRFSPGVCAALAGCGLLHMMGGILPSPTAGAPVFYETWLVPDLLKYDQLVHFTTTAVVTAAVWQACGHWLHPDRSGPFVRAALAVLAGLGFGALNEGFEFLSSLAFHNFVGGLENAGWDLVFNAFGAATAGIFLALSAQAPAPRPMQPAALSASPAERAHARRS
jgi:hypothetical protein